VTIRRNPKVLRHSNHDNLDPDFQLHPSDFATTEELELPTLLGAEVLVGVLALAAAMLVALPEALGLAEAEAVIEIADELSEAVIPTHSVARKAEINAASVGLVCVACRHEMHPGPLADSVGQRQTRLFKPQIAAAAATLWHCGTQASGFAQILMSEDT